MAIKLLMPKLGLNMVEGQITDWLKDEGEQVEKGEVIYVVETDKASNEVLAPDDGVLYKKLVPRGVVVPVRKIVGVLSKKDENVDLEILLTDDVDVQENAKTQIGEHAKSSFNELLPTTSVGRSEVRASPMVKRLAGEKGIDLNRVDGTGPGGRITVADVENFSLISAPSCGADDLPGKLISLGGVRKLVAERMAISTQTSAMVTLHVETDVRHLVDYRKQMKDTEIDPRAVPSFNAILAHLIAKALRQFPYLNASMTEEGIKLYDVVNVGLAVDTPEGLVVIVAKDADQKTIPALHKEIDTMTDRALHRKSRPEDLEGSTFTLTNLGMYGVDFFNPIINPPESAILGVGRFVEKDLLVDGKVQHSHVAYFSLTFDHRVVDGAPAAQFLQALKKLIADFRG